MQREVRSNKGSVLGNRSKGRADDGEATHVGAAFEPKKGSMAAEAGEFSAEGRGGRRTTKKGGGAAIPMGDGVGPTAPVVGGLRPRRRFSRGWVFYNAVVLLFLCLPLLALIIFCIWAAIKYLTAGPVLPAVCVLALLFCVVAESVLMSGTYLNDGPVVVAKGGVRGRKCGLVGAEEVDGRSSSGWLPDIMWFILMLGVIALIGNLIISFSGVGNPYHGVIAVKALIAVVSILLILSPLFMLFEAYRGRSRGDAMYVLDDGTNTMPPVVVCIVDQRSRGLPQDAGQQDESDTKAEQGGDQEGPKGGSHTPANDIPEEPVSFVVLTQINEGASGNSTTCHDTFVHTTPNVGQIG
ncbi:MAG: hypothetical protein ACTJLK_00835 [Anaplasma sp.]